MTGHGFPGHVVASAFPVSTTYPATVDGLTAALTQPSGARSQ